MINLQAVLSAVIFGLILGLAFPVGDIISRLQLDIDFDDNILLKVFIHILLIVFLCFIYYIKYCN